MTSLQTILDRHSIPVAEIVRESMRIEQTTPRDRQLRVARKIHRRGDQETKTSYAEAGIEKPRSGAPLRAHMVDRALRGGTVSRRQRAKIVRALNRALERRGEKPVAATDLAEPKSTKGDESFPALGE